MVISWRGILHSYCDAHRTDIRQVHAQRQHMTLSLRPSLALQHLELHVKEGERLELLPRGSYEHRYDSGDGQQYACFCTDHQLC